MRIGLVGYLGFGNYGDELFVELYRRIFRGHHLTVLGQNNGFSGHDPAEVAQQDAIIIGGGDLVLTDHYVDHYWDPVLLERPVYIAGVGVDFSRPMNTSVVSRLAEFFQHENVRAVTARDRRSRWWIAEHLSPHRSPGDHADLVAALPFQRPANTGRTLGIVLRSNEEIDRVGLAALRRSAMVRGQQAKLIVLGTGTTAKEDVAAITPYLENGEAPVLCASTDEITEKLGGCDAVASQRFHGCLAAMLMGVPTVGLLTNSKFESLFELLERPPDLVSLSDPSLSDVMATRVQALSPAEIQALRRSASQAVRRLRRAVLAEGISTRRMSHSYAYHPGFLDGRSERAARIAERSPRLRRNGNAALEMATELAWYRGEIRRRKGSAYLQSLDRLIDSAPQLRRYADPKRAVVCIPVAGTAEHRHIYGTLSLYAQQTAADLAATVVLAYVNYPDDVFYDEQRTARLRATVAAIERARTDFPQLPLATVTESFDHRLPSQHSGIIGYVGRRLYDLAMMTVERATSAGRIDSDSDALLIRNDADAVGMSERYLQRLLAAASRHPDTDVFQGFLRWGTHHYGEYPGYGIVMAMKEALRALTTRAHGGYDATPGTNGSNVAVRMSALAAVGGIGNGAYYGAGGDDLEIALRLHAVRVQPRRWMRHVSDAMIDTSGERPLLTYRTGRSVIETWGSFNNGPYGYTERTSAWRGLLLEPERDDPRAVVSRIERHCNDLARGWAPDPTHFDAALRLVIGSRDNNGRSVYEVDIIDGRPRVRFTEAGSHWIEYRLNRTREGLDAPYGLRLRRALYGAASPHAHRRLVAAQ